MTPSELNTELGTYRPPKEFLRIVQPEIEKVTSDEFFRRPKYKLLQEAWILEKFGTQIGAESIRMELENWPDAYAIIDGTKFPIEITEAINPGRRRADEYANWKDGEVRMDPIEEWKTRVITSIQAVKNVIQKKLAKNYSARCSLLIYMSNCGSYGVYDHLIRDALPEMTKPAKQKFENVWVLWNGNLTEC